MKTINRPELQTSREHFIRSVTAAQKHDALGSKALKKYGDHGSLISGIVRDHFPENIKNQLRELAREVTRQSDLAWAAKPKGVRHSTMLKLSRAVAQTFGHGFYGPRPNPARKRTMRKNPTQQEIARKRIAIKRQIRRAGVHVDDPNADTRTLRALRRDILGKPGYQIATLHKGKVLFSTSIGFSPERHKSTLFYSMKIAKVFAQNVLRAPFQVAIVSAATDVRDIFNRLSGIRRGKV